MRRAYAERYHMGNGAGALAKGTDGAADPAGAAERAASSGDYDSLERLVVHLPRTPDVPTPYAGARVRPGRARQGA